MADYVTRYVNTAADAGGDGTTNALTGANCAHTSLVAWMSGVTSRGSDLVTRDVIERVYCEGSGEQTTTSNYGLCNTYGKTTDATRYFEIIGNYTPTTTGSVWNTSCFRLAQTNSSVQGLYLYDAYVKLRRIQYRHVSTAAGSDFMKNNTVEIDRCLFKAEWSGSATGNCVYLLPGTRVYNSIFLDIINGTNDCRGVTTGASTAYVYSCTFHNCYRASWMWANAATFKNCLAQDCGAACFAGTYTAASTNNCSDDNTEPGSNQQNGEVTFVDEANDDFHLSADDAYAKGNGANLYEDATIAITVDIAGNARPNGVQCIGAFEYVESSPALAFPPLFARRQNTLLRR